MCPLRRGSLTISHSERLAWGDNDYGQCKAPPPNTGYVAIAAGWSHNLAIRATTAIDPFVRISFDRTAYTTGDLKVATIDYSMEGKPISTSN